jgi:hypothetical protein
MAVQGRILFDRPYLRTGGQKRGGEGAEAGSDLDHQVARTNSGEIERLAHDISVDKKILAEGMAGAVAKPIEQGASRRGGERHGRRPIIAGL